MSIDRRGILKGLFGIPVAVAGAAKLGLLERPKDLGALVPMRDVGPPPAVIRTSTLNHGAYGHGGDFDLTQRIVVEPGLFFQNSPTPFLKKR